VRYVGSLLSLGCQPAVEYAARIGHPFQERDQLARTSPVNRIADFKIPLLIFHGRGDAYVPVSHAVMFAESLQAHGRQRELVIYQGEGHRYTRPQNLADFQARSMRFLLDNLGCAIPPDH
jgi:dipeptidyl aminopeptidase/acylaminoacyl peptidase